MPSSIEKLQKILKLEAELGYENRAVVGGLEKYSPVWEIEARTTGIDQSSVQSIVSKLTDYPNLDKPSRVETVIALQDTLRGISPSQPISTRPPASVSGISQHQSTFTSRNSSLPQPDRRSEPSESIPRKSHPASRPVEAPVGLDAPLTVIHGIGPRNAQILETLGLNTLEDLLYYFPRRYDDYSQLKPINRIQFGEELTIIGTIQSIDNRKIRGGQSNLTEAVLADGSGFLRLTWFNNPWIANRLTPGTQIVVSGRVDMYLGRLVITNPDWEFLEQEHLFTSRIVPVYALTSQITQRVLRKMMHQTVSFWAPRIQDYLPGQIRSAAGLIDLATALSQVHFPDSQERLKAARARLAFDEIFLLQLGVLRQQQNWQAGTARIFETSDEWLENQINRLPYILTGAQQRAIRDIRTELTSGRPMNRLLQGDVGSGKTIVAALGMGMVIRHGAQAAIMAPTSILAEQHYRNLKIILSGETDETNIIPADEIRLLIGDTSESDKTEIRSGLESGKIKVVIGTHALIEDPIIFKDLQFIVVDEQHRFGVAQRAALRQKGENPHLLVMTATPIPRSLALTVYGDLDLSVMDEMPAGRQIIDTFVIPPVERERAYRLIRKEISEGHQAFIIYPLVEKGDRDEGKAAVEEHDRLQKQVFPHLKLGLLHGRMRPDEKDHVMSQFRNGDFNILISTSVVEVGVDIPNATVMLIEGANRFGLAQLHQFRGRVGRGEAKSYCLLIPESEDSLENERLSAMAETNDGFILAEKDLEQRGPGEFLGSRQAGFSGLRLANLTDIHLIEKARSHAQSLFSIDPDLSNPDHEALARNFRRFWSEGRGDIS